MKKILIIIGFLFSIGLHAQAPCELPSTDSGTLNDWIVKEDSSCYMGTHSMTVKQFFTFYQRRFGLLGIPFSDTNTLLALKKDTQKYIVSPHAMGIFVASHAGTVTSVGSGYGLIGGTITTNGMLKVDTSKVGTLYSIKSQINDTARILRVFAISQIGDSANNYWGVKGNSGTNPSSNFIGTTDNKPLRIRVVNKNAGRLEPINGNTAWGAGALGSLTISNGVVGNANGTGCANTAIGDSAAYKSQGKLGYNEYTINVVAIGTKALYSSVRSTDAIGVGKYACLNDSAPQFDTYIGTNTAAELFSGVLNKNIANETFGYDALYGSITKHDTNISYNIAIGQKTIDSVKSNSQYNIAIGSSALSTSNSVAGEVANIAIGAFSLANNTQSNNIAIGYQAANANTTGADNTYTGYQAGFTNTTSNFNTGVGYFALKINTGAGNTAFGDVALAANTTGGNNTADGFSCFDQQTTSISNTGAGQAAGHSTTTGSFNTYNGSWASWKSTTGNGNTANGDSALATNTAGSKNTAIGAYADVASGNLTNAAAIGYKAIATSSNSIALGNPAIDSVRTYGIVCINNAITSVSASVSGTVTFSQPFGGIDFKKIVIYCNATSGTATYTFPIAFANTPGIILCYNGVVGTVVTSISSTSVTITGSATTGYLFLEGN